MSDKNFYLTTTLPYVNAPLHLGHATEIIRADALARYKKLSGYEVFFNTGTDEHGAKIFESAKKAGKDIKTYVDEYAILYKETLNKFGVMDDTHFVRTTDERHVKAAQEFWTRCANNGYIYKKNYQAKYCVGCERELTESELVDGKCPEHNVVPELIDEENYFFKFSEFGERLLKYYDENPDFIVPDYRMNEMREFIKRGLQDFSISRLSSKMSWGVPVPNDPDHVMYVWFDALTNYISTLDWPENIENFNKYWDGKASHQYCGKDNTRFQGVMWQAMLLAAELPQTSKIIVNGFILGDGGVKMSKSIGNVINPVEIIDEYGTDALRYFVLREFHPFEDSAVSKDSLKESYNANLANGLGNLVSRTMTMAVSNDIKFDNELALEMYASDLFKGWHDRHVNAFERFNLQEACDVVWEAISFVDKYIQKEEPFKVIKNDKNRGEKIIKELLVYIDFISVALEPLLPETSSKIQTAIKENKKPENLFLRK